MRMVADAVGGVAEQPAPKFRVIAVANDNQVVAAFIGEAQNDFGRVAVAGFAADGNTVLRRGVFDFFPPLSGMVLIGITKDTTGPSAKSSSGFCTDSMFRRNEYFPGAAAAGARISTRN